MSSPTIKGATNFAATPTEMQPIVSDIVNSSGGKYALSFEALIHNRVTDRYFEVIYVNSIDLYQEFENNIGDMINLNISVDEETYNDINNNYKDMICELRGYMCDPLAGEFKKDPIIEIAWFVIIENRSNASKFILPKQELGQSGEAIKQNRLLEITLKLYNPGILRMKSRKSSGIFRNTTLANYIGFVSTVFGAKTFDLTPPDNTTVIENLVVEPMHYMADIFDYLQQRYGIYLKGVSVYYTGYKEEDSCLYIYPKYETHPTIKQTSAAEILFIGKNNVPNGWRNYKDYPAGSKITYKDQEYQVSGLKILCGDIKESIPLGDTGIDSVGSLSIMFNANRTIDRWRSITVDAKNQAVPIHNPDIVDGMKTNRDFLGFATAQYNPRYDISDNNPYAVNERLALINGELLVLNCTGVEPWLIKPGQLIMFSYSRDTISGLSKIYGIAHSIHYVFIPVKTTNKKIRAFQCNAEMVLRIRPES